MGRLFWKIFLSFWLILILIVVVSNWGVAFYLQNMDDSEEITLRENRAELQLDYIAEALEQNGVRGARRFLRQRGKPRSRAIFLDIKITNAEDEILLHRQRKRRLAQNPPLRALEKSVTDAYGNQYQIIAKYPIRVRLRPFYRPLLRPFQRNPQLTVLWVATALALSGLICFWLAWYITRPIRYLQAASRQLANGKLDIRVSPKMGKRRDEMADLGHDFDHMAEQLQQLIQIQKQLLNDISHELRSPLARLQVAIGLTRQKSTDNTIQEEIDRIERETVRLDELIGEVLTLSRLEANGSYPKEDYVDIALLLESIVDDAQFEAKSKNRAVELIAEKSWTLKANTELLHRSLENIIRNAIRYTKKNTNVTVKLASYSDNQLHIQICDQGSGVPEDKLPELFKPFVRLSQSRSRDSGGYGLGLAIAERSVRLHDGIISAKNRTEGGLCVNILLPLNNHS